MKIHLYIPCLLLLCVTSLKAQNRCGTSELHKMKMESDPQYRAYYENIDQKMKAWTGQSAPQRNTGINSTIVIPVVVHILWNTNAQNISDAQIQSQITVMNEDFSGNNADQSQIPNAFKGLFGNAQISFCLATRTANGSWTNGIERRQTSITSFGFGDAKIKDYSQGGLNAWDRNKYLNLWVCNLGGNTLGYTEMPGGPAGTDGAVILYSAFGRGVAGLLPGYNKGRTVTHELGHWLGLFHVWGDDGGACTGSDYITDTPVQTDASYGCPSFPLTDVCTDAPPGVMFMNYLDYSDDNCMHMFSVGQVAAMHGVLNSTRVAILSSNGCSLPTGFAEITATTYIDVYPNPANEEIHISFHHPAATVLNVSAYDLPGQKLITSDVYKTGEQDINLDITALKSGSYILVVNTDQGTVAKRFAVAR